MLVTELAERGPCDQPDRYSFTLGPLFRLDAEKDVLHNRLFTLLLPLWLDVFPVNTLQKSYPS